MNWGLPLILMLVLFLFKVPVFISILASSVLYFLMPGSPTVLVVAQRMLSGMESLPLLAIPFFIMAGVFMNYTGITRRIMRFAELLTGRMPGGLAQVNILLSTLMGGLSGSSIADAAMQAKMLVPEMEKRGMSRAFSAVVTGASSLITSIIPPGIAMIIYGYTANVPIDQLFLGGFGPGILCCLLMMLLTHFIAKKKGYTPVLEKPAKPKEILVASKDALAALVLPIVIIGGIRIGVFTATEAGAIAVAYALLLGFVLYRELKWSDLKIAMTETTATTASIMLIMASASIIAWFLTIERVPQICTEFILNHVHGKYAFLIFVNVFLLIVGMFIEGNAAMLILIPLLQPAAMSFGLNPIHFGIVFIFNMVVGSLTPPLGTVMFTTCAATKTSVLDFMREGLPYYLLLFGCLLVITFVPQVVLFLPNLFS